MAPNPFERLGLPLTATDAEIKVAYRRLVALYHPDNNPGFPVEATQKVRELNEAYTQARAGWTPPVGAAPGPTVPRPRHHNPPRVWDPPKPPRKPVGPQVPPAKYTDVPPPRSGPPRERASAAATEREARTASLIDDLVKVGFYARAEDAALDHAVVDALLPLRSAAAHLRTCARYEEQTVRAAAGGSARGSAGAGAVERFARRHQHEFLHAVPSLAIGGIAARQEAIDRIARTQFVACSGDHLLWTVSTFAPGDGILLQENIDVFAIPLAGVLHHERKRGDLQIALESGATLSFRLDRKAAERLDVVLSE